MSNNETITQRRRKKGELEQDILSFLRENSGVHETGEIARAIDANTSSISRHLKKMAQRGLVVEVGRGHYHFNDEGVFIARTEAQNRATINRLLNVYDQVLDRYGEVLEQKMTSEMEPSEKALLLNNFKLLASTADVLMKRWSIVHHGHDPNTRQAQEDAKAKTEEGGTA